MDKKRLKKLIMVHPIKKEKSDMKVEKLVHGTCADFGTY